MTLIYLKFAVPIACLLTALIIVIHAQAFDDPVVRSFVTPTDCAMPCFMGITPGVTTKDDAIRILRGSGWVKNLTIPPQSVSRAVNIVIWQWLDRFPLKPTSTAGEAPYGNFLTLNGDIVDSLAVITSIPLADFLLIWQKPSEYVVASTDSDRLYYGYVYPQQGVYVVGEARCPYLPAFWTNATNLIMGARRQEFQTGAIPNDGLFLRQVVQFDHKSCGG